MEQGFYYVKDRSTGETYADVLKTESGGVVSCWFNMMQQFFDSDGELQFYCDSHFGDDCVYVKAM